MESRILPSTIKFPTAFLSKVNLLVPGAALAAVVLSSCMTPYNPPPSTYEEREASARRLNQIENENFRARDRERRSAAQSGGYYLDDPANSMSGARPVW